MPVALAPAVTLLPNCIMWGKGCTSWCFNGADLFLQVKLMASTILLLAGSSRPSHVMHGSMPTGSLQREAACLHVGIHVCRRACCCFHCLWSDRHFSTHLKWHFSFFFFVCVISSLPLLSYGRVYTADPYHALAPAASYGVGAVVSGIFFIVLFLISTLGNCFALSIKQWNLTQNNLFIEKEGAYCSADFPDVLHSGICVCSRKGDRL